MDAARIRQLLKRLEQADVDVFGASSHDFKLFPTVSEGEISSFELLNDIRLPTDYHQFLTTLGNGGAGPFYGIFPLGNWLPAFDLKDWDRPTISSAC